MSSESQSLIKRVEVAVLETDAREKVKGNNITKMSATLRLTRGHDSDSSSDFYNPEDDERKEESKGEPEVDDDCPWRSAVDPASGKTYYYHITTRATQWMKPIEMASREEKEALAAKEKRQKDFFAAMEANILQSIAQGFKAPEKTTQLDMEFENTEISVDPLSAKNASPVPQAGSTSTSTRQLSPTRGRLIRGTSSSSRRGGDMSRDPSRPNLVRTISSMDTNVLRDLIKRVPSSRQVVRANSRQPSNRSIGYSSQHSSRQGRFASGPLNAKRGVSPMKKVAPAPAGGKPSKDDDDDDDLPPLSIVTTPDLRRRESLKLDGLGAGDPRDNMIRADSMTLDHLALQGGGGGNTMDSSKLLDHSIGSRLTMSQTSFHGSFQLDPDNSNSGGGAGGFMGHLGGSFNKSQGLMGNCSFNSFDSSESSFQGLNASANGLSVASTNLQVVEEVMNESELGNPGLHLGNAAVLEGEDEDGGSADEASLSFGQGDFTDDTTANWLDALPPEDGADGEELVGYGSNAKPFSDAGFTSFFDESRANFDLSDKETKALQKLAIISEQMAKVAEGDESSDETEEDDSDDIDDLDLNGDLSNGQSNFPLLFELEDDEPSSENEIDLSPSFRTPVTSSTTKTTGTTSTREPSRSPVQLAPVRRTVGPRNTRVARAQRNLSLDHDSDEDEPANPMAKLSLTSATLTIDNARTHGRNNTSDISLRQNRRNSTGADRKWSPQRGEDGRPVMQKHGSASSLNSTNSIAMANAARRLSMFKLKNIDRTKLRSTTGGKGNLAKAIASTSPDSKPKKKSAEAPPMSRSGTTGAAGTTTAAKRDMSTRPNLVRRNTCGTLYVGTTMSAPDKDATIKCVCGVYRAHILQPELDEGGVSAQFRIFNDLESQQGFRRPERSRRTTSSTTLPIPSLDQITTFYRDVFQRAQMEYDCIIISLIYVERLIKTTKGALRPRACNWRSILFSCMVLSSKVWDDLSMWNADFSQTCPNGVKFPLKRINELEVAILSALSYKVKVPASEYAKYYFLLRSMLIKSGLVGDDVDTTSPLDVEGAKRLQQVSTQFQSGMGQTRRQMKKAKSMRSQNMRSKSMGVGELKAHAARRARTNNKKVSLEHVVNFKP